MNGDIYDDVDLAQMKQAFICRNECVFVAMQRELALMWVKGSGGLYFGTTVLWSIHLRLFLHRKPLWNVSKQAIMSQDSFL